MIANDNTSNKSTKPQRYLLYYNVDINQDIVLILITFTYKMVIDGNYVHHCGMEYNLV